MKRRVYDVVTKQKMAEELADVGYAGLRLKYGAACPPKSTVAGWLEATKLGKPLRLTGRPGMMNTNQEEELKRLVADARLRGAVVDIEALQVLGQEILRNEMGDVQLTEGWARCGKW